MAEAVEGALMLGENSTIHSGFPRCLRDMPNSRGTGFSALIFLGIFRLALSRAAPSDSLKMTEGGNVDLAALRAPGSQSELPGNPLHGRSSTLRAQKLTAEAAVPQSQKESAKIIQISAISGAV